MSGTPASNPLSNNPAASADVTKKYLRTFVEYKLAVNGAYFCGKSLSGQTSVFEWQGPADKGLGCIFATARSPYITFLASPRLPPDLAKHLKD